MPDIVIEDRAPTTNDIDHPRYHQPLTIGAIWLSHEAGTTLYILEKIKLGQAEWIKWDEEND